VLQPAPEQPIIRRYYAFPLPAASCDDGGIGNGSCTTIVGIDKFEAGKQTWYVRWTSLIESYRVVTAKYPWQIISVACEAIADGSRCDTKIPRDRYRDASSMQFRITQGGRRLRWEYSLPSGHVSLEGIETDVTKFTSLAVPESAENR